MKYKLEVGVLLDKQDDQFEAYNMVYDHEYGYYDEDVTRNMTLKNAIAEAKDYVLAGNNDTYGIVTDGDSYDASDVVFSAMKRDGVLIENFVKTI